MRLPICLNLSLFVLSLSLTATAEDWPAFRGPTGNGISNGKGFVTNWGPEENIKWKVKLAAPSNGSPIVSGGYVFLTLAEDDGQRRSLYCYNRKTGNEEWVNTVDFGKVMPTHKTNPHGSSTPAATKDRVVVWHSSAGLYCYDFGGKELWSRDLGEFEHIWGYGGSPVIYNDMVLLHCGPGARIFVTAISLSDGKTIWETEEPRDGKGSRRETGEPMGSWSTPVVAKVNGKDQIICTMHTRVNGYDPTDGKILWSCDGIRGPKGDLAYSSPLVNDGFCVAIGGYSGPGIGFRIGGTGNITESNRIWRKEKNPQSIGSGVFLGKHVFRPNAGPGTVDCLVAETGKINWTARAAGTCWGSMVLADGNLYVTNQGGSTLVFKPNSDEFEEVAQNKLGETCNSTPAFSDGDIFIRTHQHLYCIGK